MFDLANSLESKLRKPEAWAGTVLAKPPISEYPSFYRSFAILF
jgi:hypothetical protein